MQASIAYGLQLKLNVFCFQDYICDLLTMLDLFLPLKKVMEAVQSFTVTGWKAAKYISKLVLHYRSMSFRRKTNTPLFAADYDSLLQSKFKGTVL